jgi:hypothetical protein
MNLYLNYASEHWTHSEENPPIGMILCTRGDQAVAKYALGNLSHKVFTAEYRLALPDEKELGKEIEKARKTLERTGEISETPSRKSPRTPTGAASGSPRSSRPRLRVRPPTRRRARLPEGGPS